MKILISQISVDKRLFEFSANKETLDIPELKGDVKVQAYLYLREETYTAKGNFSALIELTCDRCIEKYTQKIDQDFEVVYTSEEKVDRDDYIMYLDPQDIKIDLKPYIQDTILLNIPFKKVCSDSCKGMCASCGANLNKRALYMQKRENRSQMGFSKRT